MRVTSVKSSLARTIAGSLAVGGILLATMTLNTGTAAADLPVEGERCPISGMIMLGKDKQGNYANLICYGMFAPVWKKVI